MEVETTLARGSTNNNYFSYNCLLNNNIIKFLRCTFTVFIYVRVYLDPTSVVDSRVTLVSGIYFT